MEDLSLHILDIAENSINAGATKIVIRIKEDSAADRLSLSVEDNGSGMNAETLMMVDNPFFTSKKGKRWGLGIPLLKQAACETGGDFNIRSEPGKGTVLQASFKRSHIDRKPLGDIGQTMLALISGHPEIHYVLFYEKDHYYYGFDTETLKEALEGVPVNLPSVLALVKESINSSVNKKDTPEKTSRKTIKNPQVKEDASR
ncbi:MAG: ATP-binding protein [Nitrospiraceae bacterium]|nr:ATP-binding protein [Nitrospiraceae bacterium]